MEGFTVWLCNQPTMHLGAGLPQGHFPNPFFHPQHFLHLKDGLGMASHEMASHEMASHEMASHGLGRKERPLLETPDASWPLDQSGKDLNVLGGRGRGKERL